MSTAVPGQRLRAEPGLGPGTRMGTVRLIVSDLERSRDFYERVLGLRARAVSDGALRFGAPGGEPLVEVLADPAAPALDRRRLGLFHLAILFPDRLELARALARLAATRWPLAGAADHLVSEALYLSDPDGNGIELYRDRPRAQWPRREGQLQMATLPLDLDDLLGELSDAARADDSPPAGTTIGHVHLQVAELERTEIFYRELLGFAVTVRLYPGALFLSAGGYHHHIGTNTWRSAGGSAPPPAAVGLRDYELVVEDEETRERVLMRLHGAGVPVDRGIVLDPSGNRLRLRVD